MKHFILVLVAFACTTATVRAGPLHDAARDGDVERIVALLDQGEPVAAPDDAGEPALLIAALAGHSDTVSVLLERGCDIHVRNKGGLTALHAAAYGGHADVAALLVEKGANVNDVANFYQMSPLHAAAEEGHTEVVSLLLGNGADVEARERSGYTPLTQAGWREHWDAAHLLIEAGAICQDASLVGDWLYGECTRRQ